MSLCKDLVYLILQFCNEENLKKTAHVLEQETGYFFDLQYFEELVIEGSWDEVERYLSSFTAAEDNKYSTKIYFEIRKQKYLEALDKHEFAAALDILLKDLKVFGQTNKELYKEMTQLLSLDDFREHNLLAYYGDTSSARKRLVNELKNFIEANPLLQERTKFPQINKSRLRRLINQSLNWQHIHCANPHPQPHIDTLFTDHKCPEPDNMQNQSNKDSSLARPYIRFDKKGNLLAVCGDHRKIKILANDIGRELLQNSPSVSGGSDGFLADSFSKLSVNPTPEPLKAVLEEGNSFRGEAPDVWEYYPRPPGPELLTKMAVPNISQVVEVARCQSVRLTSEMEVNMIRRLMYARSGNAILALAENGTHLLWRWPKSYANSSGLATTKSAPKLFQPMNRSLMINDIPVGSNNVSCFTWSNNDSYVVSSSGGTVNLYDMVNFKKLRSVFRTPPGPTCVLFYPVDNNVIAIGFDDSRILIFNIREDKVLSTLQGHSSRISGLAFSNTFNVLVSCAVDTEIVLWDTVKWEKKRSTILQISVGYLASDLSETIIQLDKDHNHFLAVHETQLAIYETMTLRRIKQWTIANFCTRISHATYSCDSEFVYAVMRDGILLILDASDLSPKFEIDFYAYLPSHLRSGVGPLVVAAHPQKPCQLALGLSNGEVAVIEPLGCDEDKWTAPPFARI
ncbi:Topless-related protein 1 [Striga hermonthica]|uniref:Topless-related protein 1 n=1 Tax=Striga hermonthica TaxID=68872 RepID=A0A9N7RIL3_STRHE|nr:Topless-related protein 1 [Striga hermonthica]